VAWTAAGLLVGAPSEVSVITAIAAVVVVALAQGRWRDVALAAACIALVSGSCAWRVGVRESSPMREWADRRAAVVMEGRVTADPRLFQRFGDGSAAVRLDALRTTVEEAGGRTTITGHDPVLAFVRGRASDLWVGQLVIVRGRLAPSDDDELAGTIVVDDRGRGHSAAWWWVSAQRVRQGVRNAVRDAPPDARALVPALVDGDDRDLSDGVAEEFRRSGLTHLMAVSGTNLTIVLAMVLTVGAAVGLARRRRILVGLVAIVAFVLVARADPSVVRAGAMGLVGLVALQVGGRGGLRALSVAVVALLFVDPWLSRTPGFVLSVAATAGILCAAPPMIARLARWMPPWCAVVLSVPLAAQLACTPVIAVLSGQVSIVAVFANVLAAPLVAPATVAGLLGGLIDLVSSGLALFPGAAAVFFAEGILAIAHHSAGLAGASAPWRGPGWLLACVVVGVGLVLWRFANRPHVVVGIAIGVSLGLVRPPQVGWPPPGWVMVSCDVGQGDATVVNVGGGAALLVDAGPDPLAVDLCLKRLRVRRLVGVIITHAHADHIAGWAGAARGRDVGPIFRGPSGSGGRVLSPADGFRIGDVRGRVLWPPSATSSPDRDDGTSMNNSSVVVLLQARGLRLLLAGDIETEAQERLVASGVPLAADVLKFPHHGSGRQSIRFLRAVRARIATVSVGEQNDYGHPSPGALRMLASAGTDWRRTDVDGDIAIAIRDGRLVVATRK
jgi:competence protein ComEC